MFPFDTAYIIPKYRRSRGLVYSFFWAGGVKTTEDRLCESRSRPDGDSSEILGLLLVALFCSFFVVQTSVLRTIGTMQRENEYVCSDGYRKYE